MTQQTRQSFIDPTGAPLALVLYKYDSCGFCRRVMQHAQALGLDIPSRDTLMDDAARAELQRVGGKTQVPCLFINGRPLYESADIIQFLETQVRVG